MRRILSARHAPAYVISIAALVLAAGGLSFATPIAHHSRAKRISGTRIRKHSISGNRLRNNTLTGTQIRESKLGKVPLAQNALQATNANSAVSATSAAHADSVNGLQVIPLTRAQAFEGATADAARDAAPKVPLFSRGPLSVYAKCFHSADDGVTHARVFVETSQDGALASGDEISRPGGTGSDFIGPGTAETDRVLSLADGGPNGGGYISDRAGVTAPDGITFNATFETGAKAGTIASGPGNGVFGAGNACFFHAEVLG